MKSGYDTLILLIAKEAIENICDLKMSLYKEFSEYIMKKWRC